MLCLNNFEESVPSWSKGSTGCTAAVAVAGDSVFRTQFFNRPQPPKIATAPFAGDGGATSRPLSE
uniref:Uncharacterized protein n=1 Tax=Tarenaya spinosa TaxID=228870 RepID=B2BXP8_9ROSI|nr:unknown [Tarenaya spinosa]